MRYYLYAAVVGAILFLAIQEFSRKGAIDKYGTTVEQAITIERVRAELVEIASAENENITVHMHDSNGPAIQSRLGRQQQPGRIVGFDLMQFPSKIFAQRFGVSRLRAAL